MNVTFHTKRGFEFVGTMRAEEYELIRSQLADGDTVNHITITRKEKNNEQTS